MKKIKTSKILGTIIGVIIALQFAMLVVYLAGRFGIVIEKFSIAIAPTSLSVCVLVLYLMAVIIKSTIKVANKRRGKS